MLDLIAGGILGGALGGLLGGSGSKKNTLEDEINAYVSKMNDTILNYFNQGADQARAGVAQGSGTLEKYYQQARKDLTGYFNQANQAQVLQNIYGLRSMNAAVSPYISAGNDAFDTYRRSLGMNAPAGSTNEAYNQGFNSARQAQETQMINSLFGGQAPMTPGNAPVAPTAPTLQANLNLPDWAGANPDDLFRANGYRPFASQAAIALNMPWLDPTKTDSYAIWRQRDANGTLESNQNRFDRLNGVDPRLAQQMSQSTIDPHVFEHTVWDYYLTQQQKQAQITAQNNAATQAYNAANHTYQNQLGQYQNQVNSYNQYNNYLSNLGIPLLGGNQ